MGDLKTGSGTGSPHPRAGRLRPRLPLFGRGGLGGGAVRVSGARGDGDVRPAPLLPADAADPRSSWPRRRSAPRPTRVVSVAPRPWPIAPAACWRAWTSWSSGEDGRAGESPGGAPGGLPFPRRARPSQLPKPSVWFPLPLTFKLPVMLFRGRQQFSVGPHPPPPL